MNGQSTCAAAASGPLNPIDRLNRPLRLPFRHAVLSYYRRRSFLDFAVTQMN
jgi:hypothetical protein